MLAVRHDGERMIFTIRVTPRAAANAVGGGRGGALVVRVTAPPIEGRANEAVVAAVAQALGVPRSRVRIVAGAAARTTRLSAPREAEPALQRLAK